MGGAAVARPRREHVVLVAAARVSAVLPDDVPRWASEGIMAGRSYEKLGSEMKGRSTVGFLGWNEERRANFEWQELFLFHVAVPVIPAL